MTALLASSLATNYNQAGDRCLLRCDLEAHAARRLPLCVGRRQRRDSSAGGPGERGSGQAAAQRRPRRGDFPPQPEDSRSPAKWKAARAAAPTSAPAFMITKRSARRRAIRPRPRSVFRRISRMLNNQNPAARHQLRLPGAVRNRFRSSGRRPAERAGISRVPTPGPTLHSDIGYLEPQDLDSRKCLDLSRQRAHRDRLVQSQSAARLADLAPKLSAGGSFFISSGSRPTSYYQPLAKLWLAAGQESQLVHRVELLRIRRSFLSLRRIPHAPGDHRTEVHAMMRDACHSLALPPPGLEAATDRGRFRARRAVV